MEQQILIDQFKKNIENSKVKAALFHTFEFDAEFFENYLLPVFLPDVQFNDNKIHNAILWRQYQNQLPPVTVYCDFYAKSNKSSPMLPYEVNTIAMKNQPFHPKTSFILMDDGRLLIFTGSNNLTESGWCKNLECFSMLELKNGRYFPENLRKSFREYLYSMGALVYGKEDIYYSATTAEKMVLDFFYKRKYTGEDNIYFFNSLKRSFQNQLKNIREYNPQEVFEVIEILSPYFGDAQLLKVIREELNPREIKIALPYKNSGEVSLSEGFYNELKQIGVKWCDIKVLQNEKTFRFNHSKIYRIKGKDKMFTVIGSVNFTKAAFHSFRDKKYPGNFEAAILYEEPSDKWISLLTSHHGDIKFLGTGEAEDSQQSRIEVPKLSFYLDWGERALHYNFSEQNEKLLDRYILTDIRPYKSLQKYEETINIYNDNVLQLLSDNPIIQVKDKRTREVFYFYPVQKEIDLRPLSTKVRINDKELLSLWADLELEDGVSKRILDQGIERIIDFKTNEEGELINDNEDCESTLNLMASHLSGLIKLEKILFKPESGQRQSVKKKEKVAYYLYTDNINTLLGYVKLLDRMYESKTILPSFYWLLLNVVQNNFYENARLQQIFKDDWQKGDMLSTKNKSIKELLEKKAKNAESLMLKERVSRKHLKWVKDKLKEN